MIVNDLFEMDLFRNCKNLTGSIGLTNKIKSIMVIEALDIEKWAGKDQLLLTSFVAFEGKSQEEVEVFFKKISRLKISGIVVKTKRFIPQVPDYFVLLCHQYRIPLIEISPDISYESIILAIHEPLLNYDSFLLRSYYNTSRALMHFTNPKYSYEALVNKFTQLTNLECMIFIPELNFSYHTKNFQAPPPESYQEKRITNQFTNHQHLLRKYPENGASKHYLYVKNIVESKRFSCLIELHSDLVDHSNILSIEKFLEVLIQKMDADYYRKNEIFLHKNKTISSILFGLNRNAYDLRLLLEEIQLNDHPLYQVLLLSYSKDMEPKQLATIKQTLERLNTNNVYYESKNSLAYIFNFQQPEERLTTECLKQIFPQPEHFQCYLSHHTDYKEINELFSTCLKMKQFNDSFYISPIIDENDLGIYKVLINIPSENYKDLIPKDLQQLYHEKQELFETLYAFIRNHLNYATTANSLYLHPKTIRYRISKITKVLQLDLNNSMQLTNYTIGCILLTLQKIHSQNEEGDLPI